MPQDLNIAGIIYLLQLLNCPPVLSTFSEEFTARGVFFFSSCFVFLFYDCCCSSQAGNYPCGGKRFSFVKYSH